MTLFMCSAKFIRFTYIYRMKNTTLLLIAGLLIFLSSCSSLYIPNVPNTPLFTQKNELYANANISLKGNVSLNTAYALGNNFALMANASFIHQDKEKKDFKQEMYEGGLGYFTTFGPSHNRIFEVYTGYGKGSSYKVLSDLTYDGPIPRETYDITFDKYFVQVDYSSKRKRGLKILKGKFQLNYGTALRMSYVAMNDYEMTGVTPIKEDNIFIEPIFFTRLRLNDQLQMQYSSGSNFGLKNRKYLTAGNSVFTLGLVYNWGRKGSR
jgi:hypothetical protein